LHLSRGRVVDARPAAPTPASASRATLPSGRVAPTQIVDAAVRAEQIVADARQQASAMIEAARAEQDQLRQRAREAGRADALAELVVRHRALSAREREIDSDRLQPSLSLARLLAERILGEQLRLDPERVTSLARQALEEVRGTRSVTLFAHPEDARILGHAQPTWATDPERLVKVAPDPELRRGRLRFETELGVVDADLGAQLDRLIERLGRSLEP